MQNRIEKQVALKVPPARVWRALTDDREFNEWFGVKLKGPFVPGQVTSGYITYPGYEHVKFEASVKKMDPEQLFSFTWAHPKSMDRAEYSEDYSNEPTTLVEFTLEKTGAGTLLRVVESGFAQLPEDRRERDYRSNEGGWTEQMKNIATYLSR